MQARFWLLLFIPIVALAATLFFAMDSDQSPDAIKVSLYRKAEVSPVQQIRGWSFGDDGSGQLRVAIAGISSPSKTLEDYQRLLMYMGERLDRQVNLILKPTYAEINDLIRDRRVDLGFVCTLAYVKGNHDFGMELVAAPQIAGEVVYYSYLIVPRESSAKELKDLRNASFAFADPMSNSGHLVPTYQLYLLNETPVSFFSRYIFTYSHDNSILAVADKLVDGAAVDSLVYDRLASESPEITAKTKVITRWGPYGMPPVVAPPGLDPQLRQELRDFLLNLHNSEEGGKILHSLGIDKFVVVPDDIYDSVREMREALGW